MFYLKVPSLAFCVSEIIETTVTCIGMVTVISFWIITYAKKSSKMSCSNDVARIPVWGGGQLNLHGAEWQFF